jgi:zinc transport system substrate-binding protein
MSGGVRSVLVGAARTAGPPSPQAARSDAGRAARGVGAVVVLLSLLLTGCPRQPSAPPADAGKLRVVTTIYPLADWVRQMYGDQVEVTCLLKPGMSVHTYEPTPEDMVTVSQADAFLSVGLELEEWVGKIARAGDGKANLHALGDETFVQQLQGSRDQLTADNPHVWMDPTLAIPMCRQIASILEGLKPELASGWKSGDAAYEAQLQALAQECEAAFPGHAGQGVVTFHNAFTYLLRRCGLRQLGVIEEFPGKEPSSAYLEDLVKQMRGYKLHVIFAEPQLSDKAAQVIAQEIGGKVEVLDDQGDPADPARATYVKLIRYDLAHIKDAL